MAQMIQQGQAPSEIMAWVAAEDAKQGPYQPCPCGSDKKFRFCHGKSQKAGVNIPFPTGS
jgi:uncharacterized protein